jgi:hypothetical protein
VNGDEAALRVVPPVHNPRLVELDLKIDGLRDARRLLADAQHVARWGWWSGRDSSKHALHAIASARERIGRDLKKLKIERAGLEEEVWMP